MTEADVEAAFTKAGLIELLDDVGLRTFDADKTTAAE